MKILGAIFIFSVMSTGALAGCFDRPCLPIVPVPVVVRPVQVIQPVVVQTTRLVPVVETRLEYRPVASYYLNYGHYYIEPQYVPRYEYRYVADPWQGYNY